MSNRFHNKWHRHNHHTATGPITEPDYSHDPIASHADPFKGDFVIYPDGSTLSARNISVNTLIPFSGWNVVVPYPYTLLVSNLSAISATVNYQNILVSEVSGFVINGSDPTDTFHDILYEGSNNLALKLIPVSSTSWATFDKDLRTRRNFYVDGTAYVGGMSITNCLSTDCISPYTTNGTISAMGNIKVSKAYTYGENAIVVNTTDTINAFNGLNIRRNDVSKFTVGIFDTFNINRGYVGNDDNYLCFGDGGEGIFVNSGFIGGAAAFNVAGTTYLSGDTTVIGRVSSTATIYASCGNSNDWCSVYSMVNAASASWGSSTSSVSGNWNSAYTTVNANSAIWAGDTILLESGYALGGLQSNGTEVDFINERPYNLQINDFRMMLRGLSASFFVSLSTFSPDTTASSTSITGPYNINKIGKTTLTSPMTIPAAGGRLTMAMTIPSSGYVRSFTFSASTAQV